MEMYTTVVPQSFTPTFCETQLSACAVTITTSGNGKRTRSDGQTVDCGGSASEAEEEEDGGAAELADEGYRVELERLSSWPARRHIVYLMVGKEEAELKRDGRFGE